MRRTVGVARATAADLPVLTDLWVAARIDAGASPEVAARAGVDGRLELGLAQPNITAYLARLDGLAVGYAITAENLFALGSEPEISIEQLYVAQGARRLGVAHALLSGALTQAEHAGCDVIVSNVPAQSRDANRFFARLGFSSVSIRRVASASALRRRLHPQAAPAAEQLLRRRRYLRRAVTTRARSA
jgi:GNAT superfamily N-acetyltransferase